MSSISSPHPFAYLADAGTPSNAGSLVTRTPTVNLPESQLLPRSIRREGKYMCGEYDVSENELIAAAQHGDQHAFEELCRRYSSITKKKIYAIVLNQEDAEDALQDTLLRAYKNLSSFRRSCKFSTWLTRIGINSALMIMRKRRSRHETFYNEYCPNGETMEYLEPLDRSLGPDGVLLKQQTILLVMREVEKLQPRLRSVVDHYYRSECSLAEAAKAQEISLAAAKSRLMRGKARLRLRLQGLK